MRLNKVLVGLLIIALITSLILCLKLHYELTYLKPRSYRSNINSLVELLRYSLDCIDALIWGIESWSNSGDTDELHVYIGVHLHHVTNYLSMAEHYASKIDYNTYAALSELEVLLHTWLNKLNENPNKTFNFLKNKLSSIKELRGLLNSLINQYVEVGNGAEVGEVQPIINELRDLIRELQSKTDSELT